MQTYENLLVETTPVLTRITLHRPKVLNALNRATLLELASAIGGLDPGARVVVLAGAGDKAFVAGADISEMQRLTPEEAHAFARLGQEIFARLESLDQVVIAEVNGYALGGGLELMLAADFAIASTKARFGQPEVGLGVTPGFGGSVRLGRRVGPTYARRLIFTGEPIGAEEALRIGLVGEIVAPEELRAKVDAVAARIAKNAPRAVAQAKRAALLAEETDLETALRFEQQAFGLCFSTEDQKEGMGAFLEKRAASWKGR